jgi:hypothetical protein
LPIDLPLLLEDVGAVDRLDSWSAQSPFRRKRSALQRSNPYGFRIAVLNAIVPHDIEDDRIAARVPIDRLRHRVIGPVSTLKSSRVVEIDAGEVSRGRYCVKLHDGTALV